MTDSELETVNPRLCRTLSDAGEAQSPLLLARFALLAICQLDDADTALKLVAQAAEGLPAPRPAPHPTMA